MPSTIALIALAIAAALSAIGARRDLQLPVWQTIAAFVAITAAATLALGPAFAPVAGLLIVCVLIAETDRRHHLIPDLFTLAILTLAFAGPFGDDALTQLIGAATLGVTFFVIRQACTAWRGAEALGWGDVKLAAAMGAVLGPIHGFAAVAIAGAATLLVVSIRQRNGAIAIGAPFGIGLAAATVAVALLRAIAP